MILKRLTRAALCAAALMLSAGTPVVAEAWYDPGHEPVRPFVPVGVPQTPDRYAHPVIIQPAPVIVLPFQPGYSFFSAPRLPASCLQAVHLTGTGRITLFESDCLAHRHINLRSLPLQCSVTLRTVQETVRGYDPGCLRDAGYRLSGD